MKSNSEAWDDALFALGFSIGYKAKLHENYKTQLSSSLNWVLHFPFRPAQCPLCYPMGSEHSGICIFCIRTNILIETPRGVQIPILGGASPQRGCTFYTPGVHFIKRGVHPGVSPSIFAESNCISLSGGHIINNDCVVFELISSHQVS